MRNWWDRLPSHIRAFLSAVGVTLVLGVVIVAGAAFAPNGPSKKDLSQQYYEQASDALSSGDTDKAQDFIDQALISDPENEAALSLKSEITKLLSVAAAPQLSEDAGDKSSADSSNDNQNDNTDGDSNNDELKDKYSSKTEVSAAFPTEYPGWRVATVVSDGGASTLSASPEEVSQVSTLQWAIVDQESVEAAEDFVRLSKTELYPKNGSTTNISGITAAVGTKSSGQLKWAATTFSIGRYSFQVLATGKPDVDMKELVQISIDAAQEFVL